MWELDLSPRSYILLPVSGHVGYQFKGEKTIISKKAVRMVVLYKHRYTHFPRKTSNISDSPQSFTALFTSS